MVDDDLFYTPATRLADLIRKRALSPVELTAAVLRRIEALQPTLNAFCVVLADAAMAAARDAERAVVAGDALGPLHGVPFTVKDLMATRGVRTAYGSRTMADNIPAEGAPFIDRLQAAGGILIGKTTTPEFGWKGLSDSPLTGDTRNPWNTGMTAGGSSSGAAAAAAAGIGPLHQGSDGAGSIRIPSAFCGVFGLKPTFGRVAMYPPRNNDNTSHVGPMTRTVSDAALMLQVMAGPSALDRTCLPATADDYPAVLAAGAAGLRIGYDRDMGGLPVDDAVARLVETAARRFESIGCTVEETTLDVTDTGDVIRGMWSAHAAGASGDKLAEWADRMDPGYVACIRAGHEVSFPAYHALRERKNQFYARARAVFERFDLLLTPALSVAAFPLGRLNPAHYPQHDWDWLGWASFLYPFNFTGHPAASVPAGFTDEGLPVGCQLVGRRFEEATVLRAAAAFEAAQPWAHARPTLT